MFGHPGATGGIVSPNMDVGASNTCQAGVSKQGSCQNHGGGEFDDIDIEGFGNAGAVNERCDVGHGGGAPEERWGVDADAAVSRAAVGKSDELRSGRLAEGTGSVIFKGKAAQQQRDARGGLEPANIKQANYCVRQVAKCECPLTNAGTGTRCRDKRRRRPLGRERCERYWRGSHG